MESKLTGSRYVLAVQNLKLSSDYYKNELGFKTLWEGDGWHFVIRDNIQIMLGECPDQKPAAALGDHSYFGYFDVEGIDNLYKEFKAKNVNFLGEIENKPWGQREFGIRTIDGHRIMFGEAIAATGSGVER